MIASIAPARAERADSSQPLAFDAGRMVLDGKRKVRVLSGGVEISRGTLLLKAAQVELKETPQGGQFAIATAADGQFVTFRQKREGVDETVEGQSRRIEYDSVSETVRFIGQAQVRVLRAGAPADQVSGQTIVYDHGRDVFGRDGVFMLCRNLQQAENRVGQPAEKPHQRPAQRHAHPHRPDHPHGNRGPAWA